MVCRSQSDEIVFRFVAWPESPEGDVVQFRLIYKGPLPSNGNARQKHAIRKVFHRQLKELWNQTPLLNAWLHYEWIGPVARLNPGKTYSDVLADSYATSDFRFLPLVCKEHGLASALDILIFRRDAPGNFIKNGGDIDNRLKTIFDTLRRPSRPDEVRSCHPADSENPFFCLLADDQLITEVKVVTDRLLEPLATGEHINDIVLIIQVKVLVLDPRKADIDFWATWSEDEQGVQRIQPHNLSTPRKGV